MAGMLRRQRRERVDLRNPHRLCHRPVHERCGLIHGFLGRCRSVFLWRSPGGDLGGREARLRHGLRGGRLCRKCRLVRGFGGRLGQCDDRPRRDLARLDFQACLMKQGIRRHRCRHARIVHFGVADRRLLHRCRNGRHDYRSLEFNLVLGLGEASQLKAALQELVGGRRGQGERARIPPLEL